MKYHPNYPSTSKQPEVVDQKTLDKWKKDKTEAMSIAYRLSRRLGQRDKDALRLLIEKGRKVTPVLKR